MWRHPIGETNKISLYDEEIVVAKKDLIKNLVINTIRETEQSN